MLPIPTKMDSNKLEVPKGLLLGPMKRSNSLRSGASTPRGTQSPMPNLLLPEPVNLDGKMTPRRQLSVRLSDCLSKKISLKLKRESELAKSIAHSSSGTTISDGSSLSDGSPLAELPKELQIDTKPGKKHTTVVLNSGWLEKIGSLGLSPQAMDKLKRLEIGQKVKIKTKILMKLNVKQLKDMRDTNVLQAEKLTQLINMVQT